MQGTLWRDASGGCVQGSSPTGAEPGGRRAAAGHARCPSEQGRGQQPSQASSAPEAGCRGTRTQPGGQSPVRHYWPVAPWACSCLVSRNWSGFGPGTAPCGRLAQGGQQAPVSRTVEGCGHSWALRAVPRSVVPLVHAALEQFQAGAGMSPRSGQEGRMAGSSLGLGSSGSTCWDHTCSRGPSLPDFSSPRHPSLCPHPKAEDTAAGASPRASIGEPASGPRRGRPSAGGPGIENPEGMVRGEQAHSSSVGPVTEGNGWRVRWQPSCGAARGRQSQRASLMVNHPFWKIPGTPEEHSRADRLVAALGSLATATCWGRDPMGGHVCEGATGPLAIAPTSSVVREAE